MAAVTVLFIDQVTKALVRAWLEPSQSIPLIEDIFHFTYVRNTGASFGLMPGQRSLFITATVLVLAGIAVFWWRTRPRQAVLVAALGLITGGALGNLVDRIVAGRVTDFFDFRVFPVFNVADIGLTVGGAALFAWSLLAPVEERNEPGISASDDRDGTGGDTW